MNRALFERLMDLALWCAGAGHFVALCASFQVPFRLKWKQDLAQLMPFNRKLLWVQSSFTVLNIIAFGSMTLALHSEMIRGDRAAIGIAGWIACFWSARILVDIFYFEHKDWPQGRIFVVGHTLLTSLFVFFAATYWSLVISRMFFS